MSHDGGAVCLCRSEHRPAPLELNEHHIWPLGMGGPNVPENRVWLCPTAHANVHELLRLLLARNGAFSYTEATALYAVPVSRYAYDVAVEGYRRFTEGTLL